MEARFCFAPRRILADAACMVRWPSEFFARLEPDGPLGRPTVTVAFWAFIASLLDAGSSLLGLQVGPSSLFLHAVTIALVPPIAVLAVLALSLPYHGLCKLSGGFGPWRASLRVLSALSVSFPAYALAGLNPLLDLPLHAYVCYLLARATIGVHSVRPGRAWAACGALFGVVLLSYF